MTEEKERRAQRRFFHKNGGEGARAHAGGECCGKMRAEMPAKPFFPVCTGDVGKTIALEEKSRRCRFMRTDESRGAAARILMFRK